MMRYCRSGSRDRRAAPRQTVRMSACSPTTRAHLRQQQSMTRETGAPNAPGLPFLQERGCPGVPHLWLTKSKWRRIGASPQGKAPHRSGAAAGTDLARHAGTAEAAIAARNLGEVLLVVVLGEVEVLKRRDLGADRVIPFRRKRLLVSGFRGKRRLHLRLARRIDRRAILGADVVALPHALRRIVAFPERLQQRLVRDLDRVKHHKH